MGAPRKAVRLVALEPLKVGGRRIAAGEAFTAAAEVADDLQAMGAAAPAAGKGAPAAGDGDGGDADLLQPQ